MNKVEAVQQKAILVLGMHRSGTSALTRVFNLLGVDLGENLLRPGQDNRLGYWEHAGAVIINEELLSGLNRSWDDIRALPDGWQRSPPGREAKRKIISLIRRDFGASSLWAIKDPRLCRLAPLWLESAAELDVKLHVVFALRSPEEVIGSLNARDGLAPETARLNWFEHFVEAEYFTRGLPRSMVIYDELLTDWRAVMKKVAADLALRWEEPYEVAAPRIDSFLNRGERHHFSSGSALMRDATEQLYESCVAYAKGLCDWNSIETLVDTYRSVSQVFLGVVENQAAVVGGLVSKMEGAEATARESQARIQGLTEQAAKWERQVFGLLETVHGKDTQIGYRDEHSRARELDMRRRDDTIREKEAQVAALNDALRESGAELEGHREAVRENRRQLDLLRIVEQQKDALLQERREVIEGNASHINTLNASLHEKIARVNELHHEIALRDRRIEGLECRINELQAELGKVSDSLSASHSTVDALKSSTSWRLTRPLRALRTALKPEKQTQWGDCTDPLHGTENSSDPGKSIVAPPSDVVSRAPVSAADLHSNFKPLLEEADNAPAVQRVDDIASELGISYGAGSGLATSGAAHRFALNGVSAPIPILSTPHCGYVANAIQLALHRAGIPSKLLFEMPEGRYENVPHFVVCPQMFDRLPDLYVAFQMEQSVSSRWFTKEYLRKLENSFAILDYSLTNIEFLQKQGLHAKQIYHVPIAHVQGYGGPVKPAEQEYDVLFYGDIENERRKRFIAELRKVCTVKVHNSLFDKDLHAELKRARLVVNIHYYEGALLETTRLWECVSLGQLVVSETSADMDQHPDLSQLVDFIGVDDVASMVERVQYWLANDKERHQRLEQNTEYLKNSHNQFDYHFYRFLLASDNISFEDFWELAGRKVKLPGDKLCLNLPEYIVRSRSFDRDNRFGFARFIGLRHDKGWIGCAMSYKLMLKLAKQEGLTKVAICEDDVEFPPDFEERWTRILEHLAEPTCKCDIFSGLMANLHAEASVAQTYEKNGIRYIQMDKMISMVFNVYGTEVFDLADAWDDSDRNENTNTIDRYLETQTGLKVLTTLPFLVGHKEDLHSTLWGFQNTEYSLLIAESNALLAEKLSSHLGR